jgi:hypothetical protein
VRGAVIRPHDHSFKFERTDATGRAHGNLQGVETKLFGANFSAEENKRQRATGCKPSTVSAKKSNWCHRGPPIRQTKTCAKLYRRTPRGNRYLPIANAISLDCLERPSGTIAAASGGRAC